MSRKARAVRASLCAVVLLAACERRHADPPSANEPSPNASVLPAPLAAGPPKINARDAVHPPLDPSADVGVPEPPRPIREDEVLVAEAEPRSAPGVSLDVRLRWVEAPPPRSPESNADAVAKARDKTAFDVSVDLSSLGRLRLAFVSRAFPFQPGSELRARDDRFGHLFLWPGAASYTPLPPGTLRAALADARLDAAQLSEPTVAAAGTGNLLGMATLRQRLETGLGRVEVEQALVPAAGSGGALLCRFALELLAALPDSSACHAEWVPLRAEYTFGTGARFELEVTRLTRKTELSPELLAVPPPGATPRRGELPATEVVGLLEERELGDLHGRALPPPPKPDPTAPKQGLLFQNHGDAPRYLIIDGVPVAWVAADTGWLAKGLKSGRYTVQARDFFGTEATQPRTLELPARFVVGEDAERPAR